MYLDHFHLKQSPFSEEPDTDIFFPEAGRSEIFKALCDDLRASRPLIRMIGSEGSGKTMLCRLLLRQLPDTDFEVIYLDNPIGSFDDLMHVVCLDLGMDPATVPDRNMLSELRALLARRKGKKKVVLIIDEAEKLFLAALERLMRAICEAGEDHVLYVLLVGRPALDANLDQLTVYCSDVDIKTGYVLEPLTEKETGRYLNFRLMAAGLPSDSREEIFMDEAVHKIFESAKGNLRLINILAEEALQASCTDKSFMVLLDHVVEQDDKPEKNIGKLVVSSDLWRNKLFLLGGSGLAVLLLLVFLFAGGGDKDATKSVSVPEQPDAAVPVGDSPESVAEQVEPLPEVLVAVAGEEEQPPPASAEEFISSFEQAAPELKADKVVDLKPGGMKTMPAPLEAAGPERDRPAVSKPVAAVTEDSTNRRGEQLYQERLRASAKWLAGAYHNSYTVQLMMLASEQAAHNIKTRLVQDNFFAVKDNLYILNKKTSPPTLFVFYGTYESMEQARQARNNMPLFLRKHHPYALSISDAMKKTED